MKAGKFLTYILFSSVLSLANSAIASASEPIKNLAVSSIAEFGKGFSNPSKQNTFLLSDQGFENYDLFLPGSHVPLSELVVQHALNPGIAVFNANQGGKAFLLLQAARYSELINFPSKYKLLYHLLPDKYYCYFFFITSSGNFLFNIFWGRDCCSF